MERKTCFVITPIGEEQSEIRNSVDRLIGTVIEPVLAEIGFQVEVSHRFTRTGSIRSQMLESMLTADLAIANLTGWNANVMYELGVCHTLGTPVVLIAKAGTTLPFDISDERVLPYSDDPARDQEFRRALASYVEHAANEKEPGNPLYRDAPGQIMRKVVFRKGRSSSVPEQPRVRFGLVGSKDEAGALASYLKLSSEVKSARISPLSEGYWKIEVDLKNSIWLDLKVQEHWVEDIRQQLGIDEHSLYHLPS